ncbi:hypothetical protein TSPI_00540 [Trichinella spiralis]|uniref:Uncharacterized protein n=1 Tax=Trichinella spiralis TaxID=6334 RepID=A0ABR3KQ61_TRISP
MQAQVTKRGLLQKLCKHQLIKIKRCNTLAEEDFKANNKNFDEEIFESLCVRLLCGCKRETSKSMNHFFCSAQCFILC